MVDPSDVKALQGAMLSAFQKWEELEQWLFFELEGRRLAEITAPGPLGQVVFAVLTKAAAHGWYDRVAEAVIRTRSGNPEVARYAALRKRGRHEVYRSEAPITESVAPALEQIVRKDLGFQDVLAWTRGLLRAQRTVCRVDLDGTAAGTGFLVARDLVLTCHHVVADVIPGGAGGRLTVRFDYHGAQGAGRVIALAPDWLVASSPPWAHDETPRHARGGAEADASTLDYVLLRLAHPAAEDEVEGHHRGFLQADVPPTAYEADRPILILQHPQGRPQQLAVDTTGIVDINAPRTRFRYRTNTEPGSSGSPCFDLGWRLVGLHHSGEPGYQHGDCNEGIPIETIFAHLPETARKALAASRELRSPPPRAEHLGPAPAVDAAPTNRELRAALATIFSSSSRIRMLLNDAGVKTTRIAFEQPPEVIWDAALSEAREDGRLSAVLKIACEEYPSNRTLADLARRTRG